MELDFLPDPAAYFEDLDSEDPLLADLLVLCRDIAETTPPTLYLGVSRLQGPLRELFYVRYYKRNQSIRLYFYAKSDVLLFVHVNPAKRRTKLNAGDKKQLKNALAAGKEHIAEKVRQRQEAEPTSRDGKRKKNNRRSNR